MRPYVAEDEGPDEDADVMSPPPPPSPPPQAAAEEKEEEELEIPDHIKCPITGELFVDPVFCIVDDMTYERGPIEDWIRRNGTSPISRDPITAADLRPNRIAREAAQDFAAKNPWATRPQP